MEKSIETEEINLGPPATAIETAKTSPDIKNVKNMHKTNSQISGTNFLGKRQDSILSKSLQLEGILRRSRSVLSSNLSKEQNDEVLHPGLLQNSHQQQQSFGMQILRGETFQEVSKTQASQQHTQQANAGFISPEQVSVDLDEDNLAQF